MLPVDDLFVVFMGAVVAALWFSAAAVAFSFILIRWLMPFYWDDWRSVLHRLKKRRNAAWTHAVVSCAKKN
jgi:hypothetical protein